MIKVQVTLTKAEGQMLHKINRWGYLVKYYTHKHYTWYQGTIRNKRHSMTSAYLTLTKDQGHITKSKVTVELVVEVSAFSECFLVSVFTAVCLCVCLCVYVSGSAC